MHEHGSEHKDLLENLGYETHDVDYKKFTVYASFFFGFFVVCIILGFGFMYLMSPTKLTGGKMGDYVPKTQMPLSAPLLQSNITARTDIMSLRRNERAVLDSSAVVDKAHGVYRVPVDQTIDDVVNMSDAQKVGVGLPPTSASAAIQNISGSSALQGSGSFQGSGHIKYFKDSALATGTDYLKAPNGKPAGSHAKPGGAGG